MINKGSSANEIETVAKRKGFRNFTQEALVMISTGVTDVAEVSRVISLNADAVSSDVSSAKQVGLKSYAEAVDSKLNQEKPPVVQTGRQKENLKILVVEDDNIMRRIVSTFLKKERIYQVSEAADGEQALQLISKDPPDLILLDILMPKMNGYEVCRNLRNDSKYAKIPIIMLSSLEDKEDLVKGFDLGIDDYISKPVDQQVLIARVNALLRRTT
jgi:PleD family two-component response regulator